MDFLRLHLPGLHQALRGALDSLNTFVSYLLGDEVPTATATAAAGGRETRAAEELGELAAGKPGKIVEEEAQEALEGLGGSQSKGKAGLKSPEENERCHEGKSAIEQTCSWGEGRSHRSQANRLDPGAWEVTKASRCQELSSPLEVLKDSESKSGAEQDWSSQAQESRAPNDQEANQETLRTREEEEVRTREPGVAGGVESEWTQHREPEGKVTAAGPRVAEESQQTELEDREAVVEENQVFGFKRTGREEEVRYSPSTLIQGAREPGTEGEDGAISGKWEVQTAPNREEARTASGGVEAEASSGGDETRATLDREKRDSALGEETGTISGGENAEQETGTTSGRKETYTGSEVEEAYISSDREEAWTTSDRKDTETTSHREEVWITLGTEETGTSSGGEEIGTTSGGEEAEEETGTTSNRETTYTSSGVEVACTTSETREAWIISDIGDTCTTSDREEAGSTLDTQEVCTASDREEVGTTSDIENCKTSDREEGQTISDIEEACTISDREEAVKTSDTQEVGTTSGIEKAYATSDREEAGTTSEIEEACATLERDEAGTTSDIEEACTTLGMKENWINSGKKETETTSLGEEAGITSGEEKSGATSCEEKVDFLGVRERDYGAVPEGIPEGIGRVWSPEGDSSGDQEEVDEKKKAEKSQYDQQSQPLGIEAEEGLTQDPRAGREESDRSGQANADGKEARGRQDSGITAAVVIEGIQAEETKEREISWVIEPELPHDRKAHETEGEAKVEADLEVQVLTGERSEEESWMDQEILHETPENQIPELMQGSLTPTKQSEEGQGHNQELQSCLGPIKEEVERRLEEHTSSEEEVWGDQRTGDLERGHALEDKADSEDEEEDTGSQVLGSEGEGDLGFALAETPKAGGKGYRVEWGGVSTENQEQGGLPEAKGGPGLPQGEMCARETEEEAMEAELPWRADWELRETLSSQDILVTGAVQPQNGRAEGLGEVPGREWGVCAGGLESTGRDDSGGDEGPLVAEERGEEREVEGLTEQELGGIEDRREAFEVLEPVEVEVSVVAEGNGAMAGFTVGPQGVSTEGVKAIAESGGPLESGIGAEGWQVGEQGQGMEEWGNPPESKAQRALEMEEMEMTGAQRAGAEEAVDPRSQEDTEDQEGDSLQRLEAVPGPCGEAHVGAEEAESHGCWTEALLPASRLDVSMSRSRVLLSRSSSQRRSRPSFRQAPTLDRQEEPPSPPLGERGFAPQQLEEPSQPSTPRSEGTPVPVRKRPLGHGFGPAHSGMMQELQARLGRPKPQ
ncbi:apolipoprotein B receptor [Suncus etruscus]|uniref:apolipoprotein B receptor n=1 Tax=Suncus etruscus TaxID=109475 RepID=UPI00211037DD|nr:apolipoprotein B receptor [Suncus etruscus]